MTFKYEPDYQALENNIIDVIKEEQIKLGYRSETLRLYYPMESINHLLGTDLPFDGLYDVLNKFSSFVTSRLGAIEFSNKESRFCFIIPPKGVDYVHKEVEDRYFLREFINTVSKHNCSLDDILRVFQQYSSHVICEKVSHGEFDYILYFQDGKPDKYMYSIKFEDCHAIYHRFTKADYDSFEFDRVF